MEYVIDTNTTETYDSITEELTYPVDRYENYRKTIITTVAYLIGIADETLAKGDLFDTDEYTKLQNDPNAAIIRCLCRLRTQIIRNYKSIEDARKYNMTPLDGMTEYIDIDCIRHLRQCGMEVCIANARSAAVYLAYLNQYITDNIDKIKPLVPDWVQFPYIRAIFLIPGGNAGHNGANLKSNEKKVHRANMTAHQHYHAQRRMYPYQMYITWPHPYRDTDGNILHNDLKFLRLLYSANKDSFQAFRYVVDATADTKEGVYEFLEEAIHAAIFVDCENVDPYSLYDDIHTSTAWDYITNIINIPVEKINTNRVLNQKSLVDTTMVAGVCKEYYVNHTESIILASSDSDFWGLIQQLPEARYLVLNERHKTSSAILEIMDEHSIRHCFMSDFAQDNKIQKFKSDVLYLGLARHLRNFNSTGTFGSLNVEELLEKLFYDACIGGADGQIQREKDAFFDRFLKGGLLLKPVMVDGALVLQIEVYRK